MLVLLLALPAATSAQFLQPHVAGHLATGPFLTSPMACQSNCTIDLMVGQEAPFAADGTGSFGDGENVSMTWDWGDGTSPTIDGGVATQGGTTYADNTSHVYTGPGTFQLTVTVNDTTDGSSLSNTFTVVVGSPPQLTLGSTQDHPVVGESVTYTATATGTSPDCACTYAFTTLDPSSTPGPSQNSSSSNQFTLAFPSAGAWQVMGSVNDPVNGNGEKTDDVTVSPDMSGAVTGPGNAIAGQNVTFTASASGGYTTGAGYGYSWTFDGQPQSANGSSASGTFTAGTHTIVVTISDDATPAHTITKSTTLQVDAPLVPRFTVTPATGALTGSAVSFNASTTTGGRAPLTYAWDFGTGSFTGSGQTTTHTFTTPGTYTIRLQVTDALGRTATTSQVITVAQPCLKVVTFAVTQATTNGCLTKNTDGTYSTTSAISLNGIPFPAPAAGHPIVLTPPTGAHAGGQFTDSSVSIVLDGFTAYTGAVAWNLPATNLGTVATLSVPAHATVKGMPVIGTIALEFGKDSSGIYYAAFPLHIQLPATFKTGPSGGAAITGDASLRVDSLGVHYDGLKIQVANAWIGDLEVKQVCFSYVPGGASGAVAPCAIPTLGGQPFIQCGSNPTANRWDGNAEIMLPTPSKATVALFGGIADGSLADLGGFADNLGTSVPIADGVFLTRVGFGLCLAPPPLQLKGVVGLSALGSSAITVNGSFDFTDTNPWSLNLSGEVTAEGVDLGGGSLTMYPTGLVSFELHGGFTLVKIIKLTGNVSGWMQPRPAAFSLDGNIRGCISSVCASAEGVLSTVGVAGCLDLGSFTYYTLAKNSNWHWYAPWRVHWVSHTVHLQTGFGYRWHSSSASLFAGSCDMGPYEATLASAAAAGGHGFTVPARAPAIAVRVGGSGGAPVVSLTGPNGTVIDPPATGSSERLPGGGAYIENPADDSTSVLLLHPAHGHWTVTGTPSSVPITTIQTAATQPPAVALGAVRPVGGGRYGLHYAFALAPGETMRLYLRGPHNTEQSLGPARGRPCTQNGRAPGRGGGRLCQNLSFTPLAGPAGVRTVVGLLTRDGMPISTLTIATFKLGKTVLPRGPKVKLAIRRGGLAISWSRVRGAKSYVVGVVLGDGRNLSLTATRRSAFVRGVAKHLSAKVHVWALGPGGVPGRPGAASRA
ncbi:MAG TPA: PKD domain-containing protein [Solirubrobacteraceae bacterium]|nr:PKD domain-containing protein [Solirubrobacteraceae bacterium]